MFRNKRNRQVQPEPSLVAISSDSGGEDLGTDEMVIPAQDCQAICGFHRTRTSARGSIVIEMILRR